MRSNWLYSMWNRHLFSQIYSFRVLFYYGFVYCDLTTGRDDLLRITDSLLFFLHLHCKSYSPCKCFLSTQLSTTRRPSLTESMSGFEVPAQEMEEEERESGSMSWRVYSAYLKAGGRTPRIVFMVLLLIVGQLSATFCDYWVTVW